MTPHKALQMSERIQTAISYLVILGMLSDTEGDRARARLDNWVKKNGLKRREPQS